MNQKFILYATKRKDDEEFFVKVWFLRFIGYIRKVFFYAKASILRRRRSYVSLFIISLVMLSFVFINLIFSEARILGTLSSSFGGTHHVMFYGLDGAQAKGASEHKGVDECLIIPVIATLESSVDTATVGKVAVLTDEISRFMQIGMTHGTLPLDDEIILPRNLYSNHNYLILGKEQSLFFDSNSLAYYPMTLSGIYNSTDSNSQYVFVNEETGKKLKAATRHMVTYDVFLTVDHVIDDYAARIAKEIIEENHIKDTDEQQIRTDTSWDRYVYRDYINTGSTTYRELNQVDFNRVGSMFGVVIAAVIMTSFMTNHTARYISEYGVLAAYGAKRRHLLGVVMAQILFVTILSLVPVLLLSLGGAWLYTYLYNQARIASKLPVIFSIPMGIMVEAGIWYVLLLCLLSFFSMGHMLSQYPFPMVRGSTASKIPFVKTSSKRLEKAKDPVRYVSFLQSLRGAKGAILPSFATSLICIICAAYIGYNIVNISSIVGSVSGTAGNIFDGEMRAPSSAEVDEDTWRGFITVEDVERLSETDGIAVTGSIRTQVKLLNDGSIYFGGGSFNFQREDGNWTQRIPYYCDEAMLPYLTGKVLDGKPEEIFTNPEAVIVVADPNRAESGLKVGDRVTVSSERCSEGELTVCAVIQGDYFPDFDLNITDYCVILSYEAGEWLDGFPADLRNTVFFRFDENLSEEALEAFCRYTEEDAAMIRYDFLLNEKNRQQTEAMASIENSVTAIFFGMLFFAMCVLDFFHSNESIYAMRREFCTLRQMGAGKRDICRTTRTSVYVGQVMAIAFTLLFAAAAFLTANADCASLANMYRMNFEGRPDVLEEMLDLVSKRQETFWYLIGGVLLLSLPLHGLAVGCAILGTIRPTKRILRENIAEVLKGSAEL